MSTGKLNTIAYVTAWIKYVGTLLNKLGNLADIAFDTFRGLKAPNKNDYS